MTVSNNTPIKISDKQIATEFLNKYDTFLFDCDGVLWSGTHLLPSVVETIEMLKSLKKTLIFVTNNSTKSRKQYTKKFESFGIKDITEKQIFGSSYATAVYIKNYTDLKPGEDKIWVFGEQGIEDELHDMGFETLGGSDERLMAEWNSDTTPFLPLDPKVKCVVAGLDTKINYHKLCISFQYLTQKEPKTQYIATNIDTTFPSKGMLLPGCGSMIDLLTVSSGREEPPNCGKPSQKMLDTVFKAYPELQRSKCCMVGDRLNTDIRFGLEGNLGGTLLVLTGVETEDRLLQNSDHGLGLPKYYANKLGDLYEFTH
ncbi:hypothetical protein ACO0RG_000957 [Hanseniaspora osmophila]|uniref:4-nitrophenylphosphatase n=1 Tax=Hanseniaspora osmophila TaxID=56408 RepID=A0A1E5RNY2_9ASCO|nr:4-nitrophenylphosphatase [Hanseniaspora osmophila]